MHGRTSGLKNHQVYASSLLTNEEQAVARYNSNHISSLQHNLKQNIMSGAVGGGSSSVRNGGFSSNNFGYQLNSESNGMMNFGD